MRCRILAERFADNQYTVRLHYRQQKQPLLLLQLLESSSWVSPKEFDVNLISWNAGFEAALCVARIRVGKFSKSRQIGFCLLKPVSCTVSPPPKNQASGDFQRLLEFSGLENSPNPGKVNDR